MNKDEGMFVDIPVALRQVLSWDLLAGAGSSPFFRNCGLSAKLKEGNLFSLQPMADLKYCPYLTFFGASGSRGRATWGDKTILGMERPFILDVRLTQ